MDSVQAFGAWGEGSNPSEGTKMKFPISNFQFPILFLIIPLSGLLLPLVSLGAGLVPCGGAGEPACQLCHLFVLLDNIIDFFLKYIVIPVATLLLVIGGLMFFLYAEDPSKVEQAKSLLRSTIIGLVMIFAAWLIINTFFMAIGVADWTGLKGGWFKINC